MDYNELINNSKKAIMASEFMHPMTDVVTLRDALDFAEWYHKNELSKLHQPTVISAVCDCNLQHRKAFENNLNECRICSKQIKQTDL